MPSSFSNSTQTRILATAAATLFCTMWHLAPHAAIVIARQAHPTSAAPQPWTSNATLARLRALKQLQMDHHRSPWLFTTTELMMFYHERIAQQADGASDNRTRKVWSRKREYDRVMVPHWLRRLRLWLMVN